MNNKLKKEDDFEFELKFCLEKPIVFLNEAKTLKYSAQVLYEFEDIKMKQNKNNVLNVFSNDVTFHGYFPFRTIRMLMAYSLENIGKYIIVRNFKKENSEITKLPIKEIKTHSLERVFNSIGYKIHNDFKVYLSSWNKCSLWAGRYPLPVKAKDMNENRESVNGMGKIRFSFGSSQRLSESDVLHTNISEYEHKAYLKIFDDLIQMI